MFQHRIWRPTGRLLPKLLAEERYRVVPIEIQVALVYCLVGEAFYAPCLDSLLIIFWIKLVMSVVFELVGRWQLKQN